jgi:hypothetical protein
MLRRKRNREKQTDDFVGSALRLPTETAGAALALQLTTKNKLSGPMAVGLNSSKAFEGGNWRKRKWQTKINWWSNSAA